MKWIDAQSNKKGFTMIWKIFWLQNCRFNAEMLCKDAGFDFDAIFNKFYFLFFFFFFVFDPPKINQKNSHSRQSSSEKYFGLAFIIFTSFCLQLSTENCLQMSFGIHSKIVLRKFEKSLEHVKKNIFWLFGI